MAEEPALRLADRRQRRSCNFYTSSPQLLKNYDTSFNLFQQPVDKTEEHKKVILIQLLHTRDCLLNQFGILRILIEKLLRCKFKVIADGEKFLHRGQSLARGDIINITSAVPEVIAHLVF